jgi:tetratricopeptide (TPR) repeat protein
MACTHAVVAPPPPAEPPDPRDTARALADKGLALYEAGDYRAAVVAFSAAYDHFKAPTVLLMIARTREKLGHLRKAYELYREVAETDLDPYEPAPYHEAQQSAVVELASLERRMPAVKIQVTGASGSTVWVTIDGNLAVEPGERVPLEPGRHEIIAEAKGRSTARREVVLEGNTTQWVGIALGTTTGRADTDRARHDAGVGAGPPR